MSTLLVWWSYGLIGLFISLHSCNIYDRCRASCPLSPPPCVLELVCAGHDVLDDAAVREEIHCRPALSLSQHQAFCNSLDCPGGFIHIEDAATTECTPHGIWTVAQCCGESPVRISRFQQFSRARCVHALGGEHFVHCASCSTLIFTVTV